MVKEKITFSFGKNWQNFLKTVTPAKLEIAKKSIIDFTGTANFNEKSVIDIGSGSGIFSHCIHEMGCEKLVSVDVDPFSVKCTEFMHTQASEPNNWEVLHESILNKKFIENSDRYDLVYSWGVLHHTGAMWDAISNAAQLVKPNGIFYIALYNKVTGVFGSKFWLRLKLMHNRFPLIGKYVMEPIYMFTFFTTSILKGRNPIKIIRDYNEKRGMNWRRDITDWFGGYPYEYASIEEVFTFMKTNFPTYTLNNIKSTNGLGNNWFLFKRNA